MIEFENVSKVFSNGSVAVKKINLTIGEGVITTLIGPSGCGKTTTLRMVNRLIEPTSGDIKIKGVSISKMDIIELRRSIGYVIQEIGLFPHYTIFQNIAVVPSLLKWRKEKIKDKVHELARLVNLDENYLDKYPSELSGGERQRVGVARALAGDPQILLMDEPFGAIDPINRKALQDFFLELQKKLKKTVLFVTHDIDEAIKMGENLLIMNKGEVVQYGRTKDILNNPKNEFVEALIGQDRNLRKLMLLKAKDFANKNYEVLESSALDKTKRKDKLILIKEDREIRGYLDKKENEIKSMTQVFANDNLLDVFSQMIQNGTKIALVSCFDKKIEGTISLDELIAIMSNKNENI